MRLSIVIPVRNCLQFTRQAIESIRFRDDYLLVIVDNGSTDGTLTYLDELAQNQPVKIVKNKTNLGVAKSWNTGIGLSLAQPTIDYVLVVNNDVLFHPVTLDNLVSGLEQHEEWALVTAVNVRNQVGDLKQLEAFEPGDAVGENPDFSCFMLRRTTVDRLREYEQEQTTESNPGLFDEEFSRDGGAYFEDNDYHFRLQRAGLLAVSTAAAPYYHFGSVTQNAEAKPLIPPEVFERNREYYARKHGGTPGYETGSDWYNDWAKRLGVRELETQHA